MAHAYPIQLDVTDRLIVIVGGGPVAARKALGLAAAGATRVRCVSPAFCAQLPTYVQRVTSEYGATHLDGAALAFAATSSPAVNDAVVRDARARGILVNRVELDDAADRDLTGDFTVPAVHRAGPITVAVAAGGVPTLAVAVRDELATHLDPGHVLLADAMATLRPLIVRSGAAATDRQAVLRAAVGPEALAIVRRGGAAALLPWLRARFPHVPL